MLTAIPTFDRVDKLVELSGELDSEVKDRAGDKACIGITKYNISTLKARKSVFVHSHLF